MFKRSQPTPPRRSPHPDAKVEAKLQQIISLQRAAERNEALLDEHHCNAEQLAAKIMRRAGYDYHHSRLTEAARLSSEIDRLNSETASIREQVGKLTGDMRDDDLLWLEPRSR